MSGIETADVECRIGLGISQRLSFLQNIGEWPLLVLHLRQDIVAGAVQDTVDALYAISAERFAQRLDDRDAARNGGFEIQCDAVLLCKARKLEAVLCEQRLVRGDDVLLGPQCRLDGGLRDTVFTSDQLDEHRVRRMDGERNGIIEPFDAVDGDATLFRSLATTRRNARDANLAADDICEVSVRWPAEVPASRRQPCLVRQYRV